MGDTLVSWGSVADLLPWEGPIGLEDSVATNRCDANCRLLLLCLQRWCAMAALVPPRCFPISSPAAGAAPRTSRKVYLQIPYSVDDAQKPCNVSCYVITLILRWFSTSERIRQCTYQQNGRNLPCPTSHEQNLRSQTTTCGCGVVFFNQGMLL